MRMVRFSKMVILVFFLVMSGVVCGQSAYIPPEKPKLIIGIVVEQLRYDHIEQFRNYLSDDGIKILLNEGTYYQDASFQYMLTQSAPGHATISTGAEPALHGITSDSWYLPLKNELIYCTKDIEVDPVGGSYESGLQSPANLLSSTFSDELKMASNGRSKVYSVGVKDHASILSAGHAADAAYWFDNTNGTWMSSTYYIDSLPLWVNNFNASRYSDTYLNSVWSLFGKEEAYTACTNDTNRYEIGFSGVNYFPYNLKSLSDKGKLFTKGKDYSLLRETPYSNSLTTRFAIDLIEKESLGKDDDTDFLSICYTATDYIGHRFGPSSYEMADAIFRLDKDLSELLTYLNDSIGKRNVLVYFTASHGVSEIPEIRESYRIPSGYFIYGQAVQLLRSYLNVIYGEGNWVKGYSDRQIYLNRTLIEDARIPLEEIQKVVARFVVQFSGVASAYPYSAFESDNFEGGNMKRIMNNFNSQRSGDVIIALNPGWVEKEEGMATNHNSPYECDTHVPLIWYGWTVNRGTVARKVNMTDIAATLSSLLKIPYPNACSGSPMVELFR